MFVLCVRWWASYSPEMPLYWISPYWTSQIAPVCNYRWLKDGWFLHFSKPRNTIIIAKYNMCKSLNYIRWYVLSNFPLPKLMEISLSPLFSEKIFMIHFSFFNYLTFRNGWEGFSSLEREWLKKKKQKHSILKSQREEKKSINFSILRVILYLDNSKIVSYSYAEIISILTY